MRLFFVFLRLALGVLRCGDLLPAIAFVAPRGKYPVDLGDHLHVAMTELPSDELVGGAGNGGEVKARNELTEYAKHDAR